MKKKIEALILFANPKDTFSLDFEKEKKRIKKAFELAGNKKSLKITFDCSSTIDSLRKHLLQGKYNIVHISSHGSTESIVLENEDGESQTIPFKHLADLLQKHQALECLIFNACHSVTLGMLTSLDIPVTIAMKDVLSDNAAIEFSKGFYEAVAADKDYEYAYLEGCDTANIAFPDAHFQPKILRRGKQLREADLDPEQEYADIKVFSNVWFAKKKYARLSSRNVELGKLLVFIDRLEFRTRKSNLLINGIIGVSLARMGHDNNNNWVKIVYQKANLTGQVYFADPSTSEADNSPSGGEKLFKILSQQFGLLSSVKTQDLPKDTGAISGDIRNARKESSAIELIDLPPLTNFFTGRKGVLKSLYSTLKDHQLASLHGMFGLGKTSVALKYAYEHQRNYSNVIFIRATEAELLQHLVDKAKLFDEKRVNALEKLEEKAKVFRQYLDEPANWSKQGKKYLLLFDNVDNIEQIKPYVPSNRQGHIIFTANDINITGLGNEVEINDIENRDGDLLLFRRANSKPQLKYDEIPAKDQPLLDKIVLELGCSPLAINIAGAYIYTTRSSWETYLELIKTKAILDEADKSDPYHNKTVLRAFEISYFATCKPYKKTKDSELIANSAMHIIHGSVFISPNDIPEELLQRYVSKQGDEFRRVVDDVYLWSKAREKALQFDLLRYDQNRNVYWSHRLIQMNIEKLLQDE